MLRNMATSLFEHEQIKTTVAKGKALKPVIDKLVTTAKRGDLTAMRHVSAIIRSRKIVSKLFEMCKDRFATRNCGYTIMVKSGWRLGDAAPMCYLTLVQADEPKAGRTTKTKPSDRSRRVAASQAATQAAAETAAVLSGSQPKAASAATESAPVSAEAAVSEPTSSESVDSDAPGGEADKS
jgi:large subunit ribosomal protein L17